MGNKKHILKGCLAATLLFMAACSPLGEEEDAPQASFGTVRLDLSADASFAQGSTKAVNEADYKEIENYTIEILDATGNQVVDPFKYSDRSNSYNLKNGDYTLKAYYGTKSNSSRTAFYVEGSAQFTIAGEKDKTVAVTCTPTSGKVQANFDSKMDDYFSNYYITYQTKALGTGYVTWAKTDIDPYYLQLEPAGETVTATIHFISKSNNKENTKEVTCLMKPNQAWTLGIKPANANGDLVITITIDEGTNDKEINIEIPADWL